MIGTTVGPYRFVQRLGDGGMGTVYRATDEMLGRDVAIKVLRADLEEQPALIERFRQEAMALARLSHPGIATLHGLQPHGASFLMVMEYVPGETLDTHLRRQGRLPWMRAVAVTVAMLEALAHAHAQGVVHRDIKPANVMLTPDERVKLMDFGIARLRGVARQTRLGFAVGTPSYMAPEQLRSEDVDGRTDLYAVGLVLYELLTGEAPFVADSDHALMHQQLTRPVPPVSARVVDVPRVLEAIIARLTAKDPERRYADADAVRRALLAVLTGERPRAADRLAALPWRASVPYAAATVLVVALAAWALRPSRPSAPAEAAFALDTPVVVATAARTDTSSTPVRAREDARSLLLTRPPAAPSPVSPGSGGPASPPGRADAPTRTLPGEASRAAPRETPRGPSRETVRPSETRRPPDASPVPVTDPAPGAASSSTGRPDDPRSRTAVPPLEAASTEVALDAEAAGAAIADAFDRLSGRDAAAARALLVGGLQDAWSTLMREGRIRVAVAGSPRIDAGTARAAVDIDATVTVRSPFGANRRRPARFRAELQRAGGGWQVIRLVPLGALELD